MFLYCIQSYILLQAPTEEERVFILQDLLSVCDVSSDVSALYLAQRTAVSYFL